MQKRSTVFGRLTRLIAVTASTCAVVVSMTASSASAHTEFDSSKPSDKASIATTDEVTINFTSAVQTELARIEVTAPNGERVDSGDPYRPPEAPNALAIEVDSAQNGTHNVEWSVIAGDGHPLSGDFSYTVEGATDDDSSNALPTSEVSVITAADGTGASGEPGGNRTSLLVAGVVALISLVVAVIALRPRRA